MRRKQLPSGGTPALRALAQADIAHTVRPYQHDPRVLSYGLEAADALGVDAARVFKTLMAEVDGRLVAAVVPVAQRLDLKALARVLGGRRAAMADPRVAERATGYVVGGISPIGQKRRHLTVLDTSALDHPTVLVSAGRRGLDVELSPSDLVALTSATTAPVTSG